jgi:hypothetical protein
LILSVYHRNVVMQQVKPDGETLYSRDDVRRIGPFK